MVSHSKTKNNKYFELCVQCGAKCCKPNNVNEPFHINLQPGDLIKLLEIKWHSVIDLVLTAQGDASFIIIPHIFGHCPFLDYQKNCCTIYSNRPTVCKEFPTTIIRDKNKLLVNDCLLLKKGVIKEEDLIIAKSGGLNESLLEQEFVLYQQEIKDYLSLKLTNKRNYHTPWGKFIVKSSSSYPDDFLDRSLKKLMAFILNYLKSTNNVITEIDIRVIEKATQEIIFTIKGIFSINPTVSSDFFHKLREISLLEGVIFYEELFG